MGVWSCEPRITGAKRKAWGRFSSGTFQRTWSCQHLDCRLAASRAGREYTAVVFSPPAGGTLSSNPGTGTRRAKHCFLTGAPPAHPWPIVGAGGHSRVSLQLPVPITVAASPELCAREIKDLLLSLTESTAPTSCIAWLAQV